MAPVPRLDLGKKMEVWSKTTRKEWRWKERPPHRDYTIHAIKQQERVGQHVKKDSRDIADMERDLAILDGFLDQCHRQQQEDEQEQPSPTQYENGLRKIDTDNIDDVMGMMQQALAVKRRAQEKAERHKAEKERERQRQLEQEDQDGDESDNDQPQEGDSEEEEEEEEAPRPRRMPLNQSPSSPRASKHRPAKAKARSPTTTTTTTTHHHHQTKSTTSLPPPSSSCTPLPADPKAPTTKRRPSLTDPLSSSIGTTKTMTTKQGITISPAPPPAAASTTPTAAGGTSSGRSSSSSRKTPKNVVAPQPAVVYRSDFDPDSLDCFKKREEALRKRQEIIAKARHEEAKAREFKARPLPRCIREAAGRNMDTHPDDPPPQPWYEEATEDYYPSSSLNNCSTTPTSVMNHHLMAIDLDGDGPLLAQPLCTSGRSSKSGGGNHRRRSSSSMLQRQNQWLEAKERKLQEARALKEQSELVEVRPGPDLNSAHVSWEKAEAAHQTAMKEATEKEKEKEELEELKKQVVRAKYRSLYAEATEKEMLATMVASASYGNAPKKRSQRRRAESVPPPITTPKDVEDTAGASSPVPPTPISAPAANGGGGSLSGSAPPTEDMSEVDIVNLEPDPLTQMLGNHDSFNLVQKLLAQRFDLHNMAHKPNKKKGHKELSSRRLQSNFKSCVEVYSTNGSPTKASKTKRPRPRVRSDPFPSTTTTTGTNPPIRPSVPTHDLEEAWSKLFRPTGQEAPSSLDTSTTTGTTKLGDRMEKRLQDIYNYGLDALKAVFKSPNDMAAASSLEGSSEEEEEEEAEGANTDEEVTQWLNKYDFPKKGQFGVGGLSPSPPRRRIRSDVLPLEYQKRTTNAFSLLHDASLADKVAKGKESDHDRVEVEPLVMLAPYQRYESGLLQQFFDPTSTSDKGRFRVHDARGFLPETMYRKPDPGSIQDGVTLLVGKSIEPPHVEKVITVMFDRKNFTVQQAQDWWQDNRERFIMT